MQHRWLVLLGLVLALAGCGGSDEPGAGSGGSGGSGGEIGPGGAGGDGGTGGEAGEGGSGGDEAPVCGNGILEGDEACDGDDFGGKTCADFGHNAGSLSCDGCAIDPSGCRTVEICGNGEDDNGDGAADCEDDACADHPSCQPVCGDGRIEGEEECEGDDFGGRSCADFGYNAGSLACDGCRIDRSGCENVEICDNDVDDDGNGAADCEDAACAEHEACQPVCGNGILEPGEACDGGIPAGMLCANFGPYNTGTLRCTSDCTVDTSDCDLVEFCDIPGDDDGNGMADCADPACAQKPPCPVCGNGVVEEGEECDHDSDSCTSACLYAIIDLAAPGESLSLTGSIRDDAPTFVRPKTDCTANTSGTQRYELWRLRNGGDEPVDIRVFAEWGTDGFLVAYDTFDPADPAAGCLAANDNGTSSTNSQLEVEVGPGKTVTIVATHYFSNRSIEAYTLTVETLRACGNGVLDEGEICEPTLTEGCSDACEPLPGWVCDAGVCHEVICGDGVVEGDEQCDGDVDGHPCSDTCQWLPISCANPVSLNAYYDESSEQFRWAGDTRRSRNNYQGTCVNTNGPDVVVSFVAPQAGQWTVELRGENFDAVLYVWNGLCSDEAGSVELACEDDPERAIVDLAAGQEILIVVDSYTQYGGPFTLTATPPGDVRLTVEVEPNDELEGATPLPLGSVGTGDISTWTDDGDYWSVQLVGGMDYEILVGTELEGTCLGDDEVDFYFEVRNADDVDLDWADDDDESDTLCPRMVFTPPADGTYYIRVAVWDILWSDATYYLFVR